MFKWKKIGKIFDISQGGLESHAQSPQTLIFDNFIRIYFSTRKKDDVGKYLSHISFVDMNKDFNIINKSSKPVIELGKLGCFDEHGIFPINIIKEENFITAYTTGWNRRVSVSADASIGIAYSYDNGLTFNKIGDGPVMTASLQEPFLVSDGFVSKYNQLYHMWYIYGTKWINEETTERIYKIAHATSNDRINWDRNGEQIISNKIENECQALPCVISFNDKHHMFFCYRHATDFRKNPSRGYRLGYAYSTDLKTWTRDDEYLNLNVSQEGWDSEMMCYPHAFKWNDNIYLLYNGNEFGKHGFGLAILEEI